MSALRQQHAEVPAFAPAPPRPQSMERQYRQRSAVRAVQRHAITMTAWLTSAIVVAIYFSAYGVSDWTSISGILLAVGIMAGLVATNLMCLTVLLAARVPLIDRTLGQDGAICKHSNLGEWVITAVIILSYSVTDKLSVVSEFMSLMGTGDFVLAVLSFVLLIAVGITSALLSVRRALPHELWHAVHLTTYAALALSIPHQFSMSTLFESGWARTYWVGLYCVTGAAVLAYRVLLPLLQSWEHSLVVTDVRAEGPDCVSITMSGKKVDRLGARAGQFFHWRFLAPGLWWHQHPFSISAAPNGSLRITVRNLGKGTARLMSVRPGTKVVAEGPYGIFSDVVRTRDSVVLVGSGVGIAPIRAVLEDTATIPGRSLVVLRASTPNEVYLYNEFTSICEARGIRLVVLVGHRGHSWTPASHDSLRLGNLAPWIAEADVYVCGPDAWTDAVVADAQRSGVPQEQIHTERFAW